MRQTGGKLTERRSRSEPGLRLAPAPAADSSLPPFGELAVKLV